MRLIVWKHFLVRGDASDCEAYLRGHLQYSGDAPLARVCERYMIATEHPACTLSVDNGRVTVGRPPAWTNACRWNEGKRLAQPVDKAFFNVTR